MNKMNGMKKYSIIIAAVLAMCILAGCSFRAATGETVTTAAESTDVVTAEGVTTEAVTGEAEGGDTGTVPDQVTVPVLMFHDVKYEAGGEWSMSAENFRNTVVFLKENGYTPVSFEELAKYVSGEGGIPEKPVCLTLDDGYFSNFKTVLPIAEELEAPVTVFMTCKTVRPFGEFPGNDESKLVKMNAAEIGIMDASPYASVQSHTYGLHGMNRTYSETDREYSLPLEGESETDFKKIFAEDCDAVERVLKDAGVEEVKVISYPGGRYHEWTEDVIREKGYAASVTSDYHHRNLVVRGNKDTLFMLGRMNVNDSTTKEALLKYLERD